MFFYVQERASANYTIVGDVLTILGSTDETYIKNGPYHKVE
jgi:hypothetical protein